MKRDIKKLISQMTLAEKARLCSGKDWWRTEAIERLGIPSIMVADGPHGLRKQVGNTDDPGLNKSVPATCFPTAAGLAASWDRELLEKVGRALGKECQAEGISILLGPGANIKRSPLCGRNFEYFSEDPYLSSELAAAYIKGVQSQGVGTSLKHFAVNNQEHRRFSVDAKVDERTLREIYLASFEGAVKNAQPWTVMCSYNRLNGEYCSEKRSLLTAVLKEEWGHQGFVVSDWGAVNERVEALKAGLELEMPSSYGSGDEKIIEAVKSGQLDEEVLDKAVERLLTIIFQAVDNKKEEASYDPDAHHQLAREVARETMVLLKNENDILPLKKEGKIGIIGAFAKNPRYQGGGSSHVNPSRLENAYEEIKKIVGDQAEIIYAEGYKLESDNVEETLINNAQKVAREADTVILFVGLPDYYESEGYDRKHLRLPENQLKLIEAVVNVQQRVVIVLSNGSPVEMPWLDLVNGVLEAYLGGQAAGGAIADILFGIANPCGKLAETFPQKLSDNPSYLNFPGEGDLVEYREGIFVGYRYYDTKEIEPLFPFGYGLSYTSFEYRDITLNKKNIEAGEILEVSVKVKNNGKVAGKEIVQLYVRDIESSVIRPVKELKGFAKVALQPGEEKVVTFKLGKRAFAYYNEVIKDWFLESGVFEILVGSSSRDILLKDTVKVNSSENINKKYNRNSTIGDLMNDPAGRKVIQQLIAKTKEKSPLLALIEDEELDVMSSTMKYLPLRGLVYFSGGVIGEEQITQIIQKLNED